MANYLVTDTELTSIANTIRTKGGTSSQLSFPTQFVSAINAIPTVPVQQEKDINFYDYDGTLLYSYTTAEWANVTQLPANPSHSGLTAQGWNWTKAEIDAQLTAIPNGIINVGQMYITTSGNTEIDIELQDGRTEPYLGLAVNGTISVDWGDGSTATTMTGTDLTTKIKEKHVYSSGGKYTISISAVTGSYSIYETSVSFLIDSGSQISGQMYTYLKAIKNVRLGNNVSLGEYAFYNQYNLSTITLPNGLTEIPRYAFNYCSALEALIIPHGVTNIGSSGIAYCQMLKVLSIPSGVVTLSSYALNGNSLLKTITLPNTITSMDTSALSSCSKILKIELPTQLTTISSSLLSSDYWLETITVPQGVTDIGQSAFSTLRTILSIHFLGLNPPTAGTSAFRELPRDCKIYVPTGSLADYTSAQNYPSSSTYTYVEE